MPVVSWIARVCLAVSKRVVVSGSTFVLDDKRKEHFDTSYLQAGKTVQLCFTTNKDTVIPTTSRYDCVFIYLVNEEFGGGQFNPVTHKCASHQAIKKRANMLYIFLSSSMVGCTKRPSTRA